MGNVGRHGLKMIRKSLIFAPKTFKECIIQCGLSGVKCNELNENKIQSAFNDPSRCPSTFRRNSRHLEAHATTHTAHASHTTHAATRSLILHFCLDDTALARRQQTRYTAGIDKRRPHDL